MERRRGRRGWSDISDLLREGYAISFDACGEAGALDLALRALEPGGVCTSAAFYFRRGTPVPLWEMYAKSLTLRTGLALPAVHLPDILDLVTRGAFDPAVVTSSVADWEDAAEAFLRPGTKAVVHRPPTTATPGRS